MNGWMDSARGRGLVEESRVREGGKDKTRKEGQDKKGRKGKGAKRSFL